MYSNLIPNYVYRDISEDIADHDDDFEAEEWSYNGRDVFRGSLDRSYKWNVYWLYDENLKRVGLAEHDPENPALFHSLWFETNPFATLLQERGWVSKGATLWALLSNEAYQDCLEDDFRTVIDKTLNSNIRLMTPEMIITLPEIYACSKCGKKTLSAPSSCSDAKVFSYLSPDCSVLFVDDSFIMYTAPADSRVWSTLNPHLQPHDDHPSSPEQQPEQPPPTEQLLEPESEPEPEYHHTQNRHSEYPDEPAESHPRPPPQ